MLFEDNEEYEEEFSNRIERENKWGKKFKKFLEEQPTSKIIRTISHANKT